MQDEPGQRELLVARFARIATNSCSLFTVKGERSFRYYEEIGLLPRPSRQNGGQRSYGDEDVRRLTFIRRCREIGFPIEQVRTLAACFVASLYSFPSMVAFTTHCCFLCDCLARGCTNGRSPV
jgi:hypothetical protein